MTATEEREFAQIIERAGEFVDKHEDTLSSVRARWDDVKAMLKEFPDLKATLNKLRKGFAAGIGSSTGVRWIGNVPFVTDDCAEHLTATFVMEVNNLKAMDTLVRDHSAQEHVLSKAKGARQFPAYGATSGA